MRVVLQRVRASRVLVDGEVVGEIGQGINLLVGIEEGDTIAEVEWMARKCLELRVFPDPAKPNSGFELSVADIGGGVLAVSQFTLAGDCRKGRRPSFDRAARPELGRELFDRFVALLTESGLVVQTGRFGAHMDVRIDNDGPVTLLLQRRAEPPSP